MKKEAQENKTKFKNNGGITLIALVITIIVLLILAGVTIVTLTGENGLLQKAQGAKEASTDGEIDEQIKLAYTEWQMDNMKGNTEDVATYLQTKLRTALNDNELVVNKEGDGIYVVTTNGKDYTFTASSGSIEVETAVERIKKSTAVADSYVGKFADIDADGKVDGVIFVDLLTGSIKETQQYGNTNGTYTLPTDVTANNVNSYYISQASYTDSKFGTHEVISPKTTTGKKRFYIMDLTNFTTAAYTDEEDETKSYPAYTSYYWYKNAYSHMSPLITSNDFGEGKENTRKMIAKWNAAGTTDGYTDSAQENQDIWKHVGTKYSQGWFIPSRAEWSAFANELGITTSNYNSTYGLSSYYWSSSQYNARNAWNASLNTGGVGYNNVNTTYAVRLATTF